VNTVVPGFVISRIRGRSQKVGRGSERDENQWRDVLYGIEKKIKTILRRHPHWRIPGDPR